MFKKNNAGFVHFPIINRATGEGVTTGTVFATVYQNGTQYSRQSLVAGSNHLGSGFWFYEFTSAALNSDSVSLGLTHADAVPSMISINTFEYSTVDIYNGITNLLGGVTVAHAGSTSISDVSDFYTPTVGLSTFDHLVDTVSIGFATVNANVNAVNGNFVTIGDFWGTSLAVSISGIVQANVVQVATTGISAISDLYTPTVGLSTFDHMTDFVTVATAGINSTAFTTNAVSRIVTAHFDEIIDGSVPFETVAQMLLAFVAGKVDVVDNGSTRTITFYRRDGSTSSFEIVVDETTSQEGQRASTGTIT